MTSKILGETRRDRITGLTGVVTAITKYITGCNQLLLQPASTSEKPNDPPEPYWFDEQRCERVGQDRIVLENEKTPGFDRPAPKK